ncbi:MAG: hypothetical protein K2M13_00915 [Muribaculaceae bacterium]|nr:hypothetical protein [Muribaculaceae bacterium]
MKEISFDEMACLMGGYRTCAEVQYAAATHFTPYDPSPEERDAEERFWADWCNEFDRLCG